MNTQVYKLTIIIIATDLCESDSHDDIQHNTSSLWHLSILTGRKLTQLEKNMNKQEDVNKNNKKLTDTFVMKQDEMTHDSYPLLAC